MVHFIIPKIEAFDFEKDMSAQLLIRWLTDYKEVIKPKFNRLKRRCNGL